MDRGVQVGDANSSSQLIPAAVNAEHCDRQEVVHNADDLHEINDSTPEKICRPISHSQVNECSVIECVNVCKYWY